MMDLDVVVSATQTYGVRYVYDHLARDVIFWNFNSSAATSSDHQMSEHEMSASSSKHQMSGSSSEHQMSEHEISVSSSEHQMSEHEMLASSSEHEMSDLLQTHESCK